MTDTDRVAKLEAEVAALRERLDPPKSEPMRGPHDYTAGFSAPASVMREMAAAVDPQTLRGISTEFRRGVAQRSSFGPDTGPAHTPTHASNNGWRESQPLGPVPGDKIIDRLIQAQNVRDGVARGGR